MKDIILKVNGRKYNLRIDESMTLLKVLREELELTGTKEGCGEGECGACTVLMDGKAVNSCLVLACEAEGHDITTIEGLADGELLSDIQEAFIEHQAFQCGFCTPGMIMTIKGFLDENPNPTEDEIEEAIAGNLCRCTGYKPIVAAVKDLVERRGNDGYNR
ncbi:MAG: (2Fe-2S)-binding protein [Thermoanaerobacteraceae bacterium]|nr:(2Fe-2S)-binding protein [Thermoanaerobacteraceae bacterium]